MGADFKKEDFMIDVAKDSSYQNQTDEYYEIYSEWRSKPKNAYGYKFVKDVREHTYEDGKGFVEHKPEKAEKTALFNCVRLTGISLLAYAAMTVLQMVLMPFFGGSSYISYLFSSEPDRGRKMGWYFVVSGVFSVLRLLVPILIFKAISHMPRKVMCPKAKKRDLNLSITGIMFMLMAVIVASYTNMYLAWIFSYVGVDFYNLSLVSSHEPLLLIIYALFEFVGVSILTEIYFRGILLQTFRQFGDVFALVLSSVISVLACADVTMLGYVFVTSMLVGLFTLRSGSIYTAIAMRLAARAAVFVMAFSADFATEDISRIVETIIALVVISASLFAYSKLLTNGKHNFNVTDSMTHTDGKTKLLTILSSKVFTVWIIVALLILILNVRFL